MNILEQLAKNLAKQGAPVLGGMIGTAIGGPAGTVAGSLAGKAIEALADSLGTPATPEAVNGAILGDPAAGTKVEATEAHAIELMKVWQIEAKAAADAQAAEIEKGFSSWNWRRNVAHYSAWGMFVVSGLSTLYGAFVGNAGLTTTAAVFTATTGVVMAWVAVNSGGKAATDAVKAWKGQA
ncbi:MAG: hypothetical protein LCH88_09215 [Proteobacteria bacterium]|nr:hypothetical protein [Pseudomonadota bacterium]